MGSNFFRIFYLTLTVFILNMTLYFIFNTPHFVNSIGITSISESRNQSINQNIAVSKQGQTFVAWAEVMDNSSHSLIYFREIDSSGKIHDPILISTNRSGIANIPKIIVSDNNVYVTWEDYFLGNSHIFFRKSSDNGNTFGNITDLSDGTIGARLQNLAVFENDMYIVWTASKQVSPNNFEIFFRKSSDSGNTFGRLTDLSNTKGDSLNPQILTPSIGKYVYVAWNDCDAVHDDPLCNILFVKSNDHGLTFSSPQLLSFFPPNYLPFLAHKDLPVISSLLPLSEINTHQHKGEHNSIIPLIASSDDGKNVYIFWQDDLTKSGQSDIFYTQSNNYGDSFNGPINLSNTSGISRLTHITSSGNDVFVVWSDTNSTQNQFDIFYAKISGNSVNKVRNLSNTTGASAPADIQLINLHQIYVVWSDQLINQSDIFFVKSKDGGNSFSKPKNFSNTVGESTDPIIMSIPNQNQTIVSWTEHVSGNQRVYADILR